MSKPIIQTEYGSKLGAVEFIWARNSKEFLFANSIYIEGKPSIIVDPSATFTYIEKLAQSRAVDIVLNTHYHGDHRSLNSLFTNVIFAANRLDAPAIRDYKTYEEYADNDPNSFYTAWRKQVFYQYHIQDCPVSKLYEGNEIIKTGSTEIQLIHIPGHTPGQMALHFLDSDCLFISDIDLTPYGPWYANVVSNIDDFIASVEKISKIDATYYVTSHGERIYTPEQFHEKLDHFAKHFSERDEKILDILKTGPKTFDEINSEGIIYRKASLVDPLKAYFQQQMLKKHLDRLAAKQVLQIENKKFILNK